MPRALRLVSIDPFSPPVDLVIGQLPAVVGSNGSSDIQIENRWVAETHCEFCEDSQGRLNLRSLDHESITLINGDPLAGDAGSSVELHSGDELTIGVRVFEILLCPADGESPGDAGNSDDHELSNAAAVGA